MPELERTKDRQMGRQAKQKTRLYKLMTRRRLLQNMGILALGAWGIPVLGACGDQGASGEGTDTSASATWRLASYAAEGQSMMRTHRWWAEEVDRRTNGQLKIEVYPNGSLPYEQSESLSAVDQGLVEVAEVFGASLGGAEEALEVLDLPGFVPPDMQLRSELVDELKDPLSEIVTQEYNVQPIYSFWQLEPRNIYSQEAIPNLDALSGTNVRALGELESNFTQALGATPQSMSWPDTYVAMQQGVLDGFWIVDSATYTSNMYEVSDYIIDLQIGGASTYLMINRPAFESLPSEVQQVLTDLEPEYQAEIEKNIMEDIEVNRDQLLDEGMEVINWPQEDAERVQAVAEDLWEGWYADAEPPAQAIFDQADQFIQDRGGR